MGDFSLTGLVPTGNFLAKQLNPPFRKLRRKKRKQR